MTSFDPAASGHLPRKRFRRATGVTLIGIGAFMLFFLDEIDIVVNATNSMNDRAYLLWERPVLLEDGVIVASSMPEILEEKFGDHLFVKRIGGLPGDEIVHREDGTPCVRGRCYPLAMRNGVPVATSLPAGKIPPGQYALFGDTDQSLDSRYALIGLIGAEKLKGRGWAIPWPTDWRQGARQ